MRPGPSLRGEPRLCPKPTDPRFRCHSAPHLSGRSMKWRPTTPSSPNEAYRTNYPDAVFQFDARFAHLTIPGAQLGGFSPFVRKMNGSTPYWSLMSFA
jgi:hypothetical protein